MELTTLIGPAALLISVLSLLVSLRTYTRDRAQLRPKLEVGTSEGGPSFAVLVTNAGRRIAYVDAYTVYFSDGTSLADNIAGGRPVKEGALEVFWLPFTHPSGRPARDLRLLQRLELVDTLGNRYTYPSRAPRERREFSALKAQIEREWLDPLGPSTRS